MNRRCWFSIVFVVVTIFQGSHSYRIGDAVDTNVRYGGSETDALRRQQLLFGIDSLAEFEVKDDVFSLTFEDGLWGLPGIKIVNGKDQVLQGWEIDIVYSKAGDGDIHAVSYKDPVYADDRREVFQVLYHWVPEPDVLVAEGQTTMFLCVIAASFLIMYTMMLEAEQHKAAGSNGTHGSSHAVPKYE